MYLNGLVMNKPELMISSAPAKFDADGKLIDSVTAEQISQMLTALVVWQKKVGKAV